MTRYFARRILFAVISLGVIAVPPARAQQDVPIIAVAASLQFAMTEVAETFTDATGMQVRLTFGASGNLTRQIREGAPFEMFMAADERFVAMLQEEGLTQDAGEIYAVGRIVMAVPHSVDFDPDGSLDSLRTALAEGRITRFAIANPEHAPYGVRAREALQHAGLWDDIQPFLVLGENVSQAAQFALSGNAEGGIIALSLAIAPEVAARGTHDLIPEDYHAPLHQRMVLINGAGQVATAFYDYTQQPAARAILARYGFTLPGGG